MFTRSPLSLEKDKFNFADNLAYELEKHLVEFGSSYPDHVFDDIDQLRLRCWQQGTVTNQDLEDGSRLLGWRKFKQLCLLAKIKAQLETDFVNS